MFALKYIAALAIIFATACFVNLRMIRLDTTPQIASLPDVGNDPDAYLEARENAFDDITDGAQKRIVWADGKGQETDLALIYIHGFSATSEEIRPVPDRLAKQLGANLYYTRLTGHGRPGVEMGKVRPEDWIKDLSESIAIAEKIGRRTVLVTTSTGGTIATVGHVYPELMKSVAGIVLVSPNYALQNKASVLGRLPFARHWARFVAGDTISWEPRNEEQAKFWTTSYPPSSIIPMMALVSAVERMDLGRVKTPALFYYSDQDKVVKASATEKVADNWGGPVRRVKVTIGPKGDSYAHVIAGDILSPEQTDGAVKAMFDWVSAL